MLSVIKHKFISLLQLLLVLIYIIFEELIWEGIAKPIYEFVHSLKILRKIETKLHSINAYFILFLFLFLLGIVEIFGIYAGILFVSGKVLLGFTLYIAKVPVAAFTFWMFRVTEDKLMQFGWFKWTYDWMMKGIAWLKSRQTYVRIMQNLKELKFSTKHTIRSFKKKYLSKESIFLTNVKHLYTSIKSALNKK